MSDQFHIKFWGVRGTIPTPSADRLGYGGNTSCVEVRCGDVVFALDAGTGIVNMGEQPDIDHIHILLSHTHIDHVMGLSCLRPMFQSSFQADIWAGHLLPDMFITEALSKLIEPPLFPVPLSAFEATISYHDFVAGRPLEHDDFMQQGIKITTLPLNHPDKATGYRIDYRGHSICYITDVEHLKDQLNEDIIKFINGTDVFVYDSTFDDRDFEPYIGWGHSTWQQAMRLGEAAQVGTIVMFHHDPQSNDDVLDERALMMREQYDYSAVIAKEGMVFDLLKE